MWVFHVFAATGCEGVASYYGVPGLVEMSVAFVRIGGLSTWQHMK